jgi:hypothetical protein
MAVKATQKLITVIGSAYFQPIADLLDRWLSKPRPRPNKVQSGFYESGYAASCVLLLVAMFESYVSRVRFVQGKKVPDSKRSAIDVVLTVYPRLRHRKALADVYVLRDLLIHGHLWEVEYEWGGAHPMIFRSATKHAAYGNKMHVDRVNRRTRRTKALGLNVLPSRIDRTDVLKVFETLWKTLIIFETTDRFQCYVTHEHIRFRSQTRLFSELQGEITNAF